MGMSNIYGVIGFFLKKIKKKLKKRGFSGSQAKDTLV
jgi:hypothetical protein